MLSDNKSKSLHGRNRAKSLTERFEALKSSDEIVDYRKNARYGRKGLLEDQFYAPFEVEFEGGAKWIVFSTTTWRDRMKCYEWDALNIREIDAGVERCLVSLSNTDEETKNAISRQQRLRREGKIFTFIDEVVSERGLFDAIEERSYAAKGLSLGQVSNSKGRKLEDHLARVMNSKDNLRRWKEGNELLVGCDFELFVDVTSKFGLDKNKVLSIAATCDIPKLPTGGKPKTDVAVTVSCDTGASETFTVSCKRSKNPKVSAMQFDAKDLVAAAGIVEPELIDALEKQQECGSRSQLTLKYGPEIAEVLESMLPKYVDEISRFVLGGVVNPSDEIQIAHWILSRRDREDGSSTVAFHSVPEYADAIKNLTGQYGTPFSWTYHTAGGRRQIQIKVPLLG